MTYLQKLKKLDGYRGCCGYAERVISELTYLDALSKNEDGAYDARIEAAAERLVKS